MKLFETRNIKFNNLIYKDITIEEKKITFIKGRSGGGKTTLFRFLNKTNTPDSGEIFYKGKNLKELNSLELRKKVLLINQQLYLFKGSVSDNFKTFYEYAEKKCLSEKEIKKFLNLCCINIELGKNVQTLSGGEKQRVFLAINLSFEPDIFLLDEITSALDSKTSKKLMENLIDYFKENQKTAVIISHSEEIIRNFAEEIIEIGE